MSLPKFIYFLTEEDGRTRQIQNGVVTSLNTPKMLPNAPDGNQEISIGWERSPAYYGNIRNFSLPLGFVMDGAKILRNDFYKFNIDRKLFLLIKRLTYEFTSTTFKEYYKQFYKGELDFSTAEDNQGEYRFEINIMEGGLQKLMKAAENTKFDIPFDLDAKNVVMDGMLITGDFNWFLPEYTSGSTGALPTMVLIGEEHSVPGIYVSDILGGFPVPYTSINETNTEYFLACTSAPFDNEVRITGRILMSAPNPAFPANILIWVYNTIAATLTQIPLFVGDEADIIDIDTTIPLNEGDRFFLEIDEYRHDSNLRFQLKGKQPTSTIQAFTLYDAWRKVVEKATGSADNFESTILQNTNILLTSGDGVRSIPNASVKLSIKELWDATNVYIMGGLQITDKVRIEGRADYFAPESITPAIELGDVKNMKITPAVDLMGTSIKVGHAEQQVDDTNGKFDFNGFQIYSTPNKRIASKEIDLQSPYKASPYEIEQTRANYEGKTTTDKSSDNDVFAIAAKPDTESNTFVTNAVFQADGTPFAPGQPFLSITAGIPALQAGMKIRITGSVSNDAEYTLSFVAPWFFGQLITLNEPVVDETGAVITIEILNGQYYELDRDIAITQLTDPDVDADIKASVFNVPLSPKRILQTHYPWLAGSFYGYEPESLIFQSANRNKELIAGGITEKSDVPIAALGSPLFLPFYFEFDTQTPVDLVESLETNTTPVFGFYWNGNRYTGFMTKAGVAPNTLEEQTFKLLATPDNNVINLLT